MEEKNNSIDSDLIRGHIDTIILKVLKTGDRYGYEIIDDVQTKSMGAYELKQPTLYSCLKRLEGQGLISSYWTDSDIGGKRHYYKLTEKGQEVLTKNQEEWLKSKSIIENLIYETVPSTPVTLPAVEETRPVVVGPIVTESVATEPVEAQNPIQEAEEATAKANERAEERAEIMEVVPFTPIETDDNMDDIFESEKPAADPESLVEEELLVANELEKEHKPPVPTALEQIAETNQNNAQTTQNSAQNSNTDDYLFSTFANEAKATEYQEKNKEYAMKTLFGVNVEEKPQEPELLNVAEQNTDQVVAPVDKTIQLSTIPTDPTYEQKQTLKMFENNNTISANFTDSNYKDVISELNAFANNSSTSQKVQRPRNIEYHPEDYDSITKRFASQGISVKVHQKIEKVQTEKNYIFINKIKLARAWTTFGVTAFLLALSLLILCPTNMVNTSLANALPLYLPAFLIIFAYPVIQTIIYYCDPNKRVPAKYAPRISLIASALFFIQALVIVYAINLQTGLTSFAQEGYNHLGWIVPWITCLAIPVAAITYYFMFKSKRFHS